MARFRSIPRPTKKTLLLIAATAAITIIVTTLGAMWLSRDMNQRIPTPGTLVTYGVEAYWDADLQNKTKAMNWDTVLQGVPRNITLYLKNTSNVNATLNQTTRNWTFWNRENEIDAGPSDSTPHMYLTWDYDNSTLISGEIIRVTLTLHTRSSSEFFEFLIANDVKAFSFDILISTSQPN